MWIFIFGKSARTYNPIFQAKEQFFDSANLSFTLVLFFFP